ncbi:F-box/LRR-repeat protein At4g14103-like [Vicia villosa]|uniref:F-box/LRR-repeat protein At4g14103-like n=1 Tax=Vicia villosa TaxID=3911 RepID=UPI00273BAF89|nr:F-box/LRR-repeat protein At4g14103-like [Vicia villosa]
MAKRSTRKRSKSAKGKNTLDKVDRLSGLPHEILTDILTLLPTKDAITTSVLSSKWISLWTFANVLDFPNNSPSITKNNFVEIFNSILAERKSNCIKRLSLCFEACYNPNLVVEVISMAINQKVKEVNLILKPFKVNLPSHLFTCKTLTVLELVGSFEYLQISYVHLPSLKILHINLLCFVEDATLMKLFSGCPVLEELIYEDVIFKHASSFEISVPTLKRLTVRNSDKTLNINTPLLQYLLLDHTKATDYAIRNMNNLKEAYTNIYFESEEGEEQENIPNLFIGIQKTQFLSFDVISTEVLINACIEFPTFHNLGHLQLYLNSLDSYFLVELLLEKCPNLKCLEIIKVNELTDTDIKWTQPNIVVPTCLSSHLTTFIFKDYEGTTDEFELISYILESGSVLKRTTIYFQSSWDPTMASDDVSRLCSLQRASIENKTNYVFQS